MNRSITHKLFLVAVLVTLISAGELTGPGSIATTEWSMGAVQPNALTSAPANLSAGTRQPLHDGRCPGHAAPANPALAKSTEKGG